MLESPSHRRRLKIVLAIVVAGLLLLVPVLTYYQNRQSSGESSSSLTSSRPGTSATSSSLLTLSGKIPLAVTHGRIDHMAVDLQKGLLFVAALGNNTVGIVDFKAGRLLGSIQGLSSPQGVASVRSEKLYVSNAGDGSVDMFDGTSFAPAGRIPLSGDADNLRYDSATNQLYVGYGSGGIAVVNTTTDAVTRQIPMPGHPESFQLETRGQQMYVNVPTAGEILVVDRQTGKSVSNVTMAGYSGNFPMALDEANGRLFVGTRSPPDLVVLDTSSWKVVASVPIPGDPDDIYYDGARGLIYVSSGQGSLEVIQQVDANDYSVAQTIPTGPGARTSLFIPELGSIYVAVPESGGQQAELLVFSTPNSTSSASSSFVSSRSSNSSTAALNLNPSSGPTGTAIDLSGRGYNPGSQYQVCVGTVGKSVCGLDYIGSGYPSSIGRFASVGNFTADSDGNIPSGTHATIPDLFGGSYVIAVTADGGSDFVASTTFTVTSPTLSVSPGKGVAGTGVTLTGANYTAVTTYTVCLVLQGTVDCGYAGDREETPPGTYLGTFTADSSGNIPPGTKVTIPATQPPSQYSIGVFMPSGGFILISAVSFTVDGPT
jgi:hypothetical protein